MSALDIAIPEEAELVVEIARVRRHGIARIGQLDLANMELAARAAGRVEPYETIGPYVIERILADAAVDLGGDDSELAQIGLGLDQTSRGGRPSALRKLAAEVAGISVEHYRKAYEPRLFQALAQRILVEVHDNRLRLSRLRLDVRTPVGSRLAVEWLTRFEAMYGMWTSLSGVGGDLTAYRSTLLEQDRPWDRPPNPGVPDDKGHTQEHQAAGYVTDALAHFATFLLRRDDFVTRFGGMWLLPDVQSEDEVADAAYRAWHASPNNERDDSYLRTILRAVPGRELDGFLTNLLDADRGQRLHEEWQAWARTCTCEWDEGIRIGKEHFPTHLTHPGISPQCDMHMLISACNDYLLLLDDAWDQIADWYHDVPKPVRMQVTAEELMAKRESMVPRYLSEN